MKYNTIGKYVGGLLAGISMYGVASASDNLEILSSSDIGIDAGAVNLQHIFGAQEAGSLDGQDSPWSDWTFPPINTKGLKPYSTPFGTPLRYDARPEDSQSNQNIILSASNPSNPSTPFNTGTNVIRFQHASPYTFPGDTDRVYLAHVNRDSSHMSNGQSTNVFVNINDLITAGGGTFGRVRLPGIINITNNQTYGYVTIASPYINQTNSPVGNVNPNTIDMISTNGLPGSKIVITDASNLIGNLELLSGGTNVSYTVPAGLTANEGANYFVYSITDPNNNVLASNMVKHIGVTNSLLPPTAQSFTNVIGRYNLVNGSFPVSSEATGINLLDVPTNGSFEIDGTNFVYTPNSNFSGRISGRFQATNSAGSSAIAEYNFDQTNSAPTSVGGIAHSGPKHIPKNFSVNANDVDPTDVSSLEAKLATPISGISFNGLEGTADFGNVVTNVTVPIYVEDQFGGRSATNNYVFNFTNNLPTAVAGTLNLNENSVTPIDLNAYSSDANGDSLSFVITGNPIRGTFINGVYSHTNENNLPDKITFKAFDGNGYSPLQSIKINFTPENDLATLVSPSSILTARGLTYINAVVANDVDGPLKGTNIVKSIVVQPGFGNADINNGVLNYQPGENFGNTTIGIGLYDGIAISTNFIPITVQETNSAPVVSGPFNVKMGIGEKLNISLEDLVSRGIVNDVDNDELSLNGINVSGGNYLITNTVDGKILITSKIRKTDINTSGIVNYIVNDGISSTPGVITVSPYTASASFTGLFEGTNGVTHNDSGFFTAKQTAFSKILSAKAIFDGDSISASLMQDRPFHYVGTNNSSAVGKAPVLFDLTISEDGKTLSGIISRTNEANLFAEKNPWLNNCPWIGKYNFMADATNENNNTPSFGHGYMNVAANGSAKFSAVNEKGQKMVLSSVIGENGNVPTYFLQDKGWRIFTNGYDVVKTNKSYSFGSMQGELNLETNNTPVLLGGNLIDLSPANPTNSINPEGVTNIVKIGGSKFETNGIDVVENGELVLNAGMLESDIVRGVSWITNKAVISPTNNNVKLSTPSYKTGISTLTFDHPEDGTSKVVSGKVTFFQTPLLWTNELNEMEQISAIGQFKGTNSAGTNMGGIKLKAQ